MESGVDGKDLRSLYDAITKETGKPLDPWEIAALLEIYGIRDIDAKEEYGFKDVFDMANYLIRYIDTKKYPSKSLIQWEKIPPLLTRVIDNYIKGLAFAMPMFVQIFFTLAIGYAIWSGIEMDEAKATVIALGTFLALVVTGGSAQAIGRKGLFYLKQEEYILASNVTRLLYIIGVALVIVVGIVLIFINFFFEVLPTYYFFVLITFYFLLSVLFLDTAVYYMFEEYKKILYYFLFGIVLVYIFHGIMKIQLPEAQFIALIILDTVMTIIVFLKLRALKKQYALAEGEGTPRASILFYSLIPFYLYGFFYFTFLVADRIVAWSTNVEAKPYFIWFDVPYELGDDWALIALVLMMGLTEVSIYEFMYRINDLILKYKYYEYQKFDNEIYAFFKKFNFIYLLFSILAILVTYFSIYLIHQMFHFQYIENFFNSYTPFVFWVASISYTFLVNALMNILFIFSFSRQLFSLKSALFAAFLNIFVGMILSRMFGLEYAVFGLFVGSVVFWGFSFRYAVTMLKKMEFYYYSSF